MKGLLYKDWTMMQKIRMIKRYILPCFQSMVQSL